MLVLDAHPHARAVLGAALTDAPAHAYLLHGPPGSGKAETARAFAGELLAKRRQGPRERATRAEHGAHPDLTWVTPSGAHEMLRRDVDESVVAAAAHTPFEAQHRIFVLERADTMNDEAANALLKTLEEPPAYVVLILITDKLTQVLPTIASRCQAVRFDPPAPGQLAQRLQSQGVPPESAEAAARLSLGDAHKALALALGDGPALRAAAEHLARAPLHGTTGDHATLARRPRPRQATRPAGQAGGRERAQGRARVPAQEGAQAARDRVQRAGAKSRSPSDHAGARPCAAAHGPVVPRPELRRRRRPRAGVPLRPDPTAPGGRRPERRKASSAPRSSSTTPAPV